MMNNLVNSTKTGANAMKVWKALSVAAAGISVQELCRQLAMSFSEVVDAIRWLSRDHNIGLEMKGEFLILVNQ